MTSAGSPVVREGRGSSTLAPCKIALAECMAGFPAVGGVALEGAARSHAQGAGVPGMPQALTARGTRTSSGLAVVGGLVLGGDLEDHLEAEVFLDGAVERFPVTDPERIEGRVGANSADAALHGRRACGWVADTSNVWCKVYLPATTGTSTGPSWSLMDRLSPPATLWSGRHRTSNSAGPALMHALPGPSAAVPPPFL